MSTISVENTPDEIVATMAEITAKRARMLDVKELSIYIHNGELSHVSVGDRTYFYLRGKYYEVVEVGDLA